jgi:hypothetical protein
MTVSDRSGSSSCCDSDQGTTPGRTPGVSKGTPSTDTPAMRLARKIIRKLSTMAEPDYSAIQKITAGIRKGILKLVEL